MSIGASLLEEHEINTALMALIQVLYRHNIREVNLGGLMRVMGMPNEDAVAYDQETLEISEMLAAYAEVAGEIDHSGHTLH